MARHHARAPRRPAEPLCRSGLGARRSARRVLHRRAPVALDALAEEPNDHPAPELDCRCGIYGVKSVAAARSYLETPPLLCRDDRVIGRVALWGDVVEGPLGWRASHAYPDRALRPGAGGRGQRASAAAPTSTRSCSALEAYRVPVDLVAPSALAVR